MGRFSLTRRRMLKGLLGGTVVSVGLPPLEIMLDAHGEAFADGSPLPVRFLSFCFGNGVLPDRWVPAATGPGYPLSEQLGALAPVRDYCNVVSGFDIKLENKITHHEGMAGMFSGYPFEHLGGLYSRFGGPSIDQVVADEIGQDTFLPSLHVGVSKRVSTDEGPTMQFMSHRGPDQPVGTLYNPRKAFKALFGDFDPPDPVEQANRVNVLDAVQEDAKALKNKLGTADRQRLDAHLEGVFAVQERINSIPPVCGSPTEPDETNEDTGGKEPMADVAGVMTDLVKLAFQCDVTRVATFMLTGGVGQTVYSVLDQADEQHFMSHSPDTYREELNATVIWNVERFAHLVQALQNVPEGDGNLLDNAVLIAGSDCSEGWTHSVADMPVILAGAGGGRLRHPGIHHRGNGDNLSDVLLTAVRAAAPGVSAIGGGEGESTTPVAALTSGS